MISQTAFYIRVSTNSQHTDRQHLGLMDGADADCLWFEDKGVSGSIPFGDRPAGKEVVKGIQEGTITELVSYELSRLGRDLADILSVIELCIQNQCQVRIHKEGIRLLDEDGSVNPMSRMLISILGSVAMMQLEQTRINVREGIEAARRRGAYRGRKRGTTISTAKFLKKHSRAVSLLKEDYPVSWVAKVVEASPTTIRKVRTMMESVA